MKQITYSQPDQSPLFRPILRFSIPLMLTGLLQLAYNTADSVVVGRYAGSTSLAAVGATTSIIFLLVTLFNGVSIGTNYLTARYYGAGDQEAISQTVHCSAVLSVILGLMAGVVGILFSTPLLELAGAPMDVLPLSSLYLKIYFLGIPALVAYNFGSAILRAVGDTLYPLIFMIVSGAMNVGLNLLFVIVFHLGVAGASLATVISQAVSGIGCLIYSWKKFEILHPDADERRWNSSYMKTLCGMGVPMGLQYSITAIGSVILQSAVNTLGSNAVASMTAGSKIGMFFCCPFDAMGSTMATYGGQNVGAKKMDRISKGLKACSMLGIGYAVIAFGVLALTGRNLALFFVERAEVEVIENVYLFLFINSAFYIPLAFVNIVRFLIQGMGYSKFAILAGVCEMVARTLVGFALVPMFGFPAACFASPVAWIFADAFLFPAYRHVYHKTEEMLNVNIQ